jgi:phospholipid N-methyltransferase
MDPARRRHEEGATTLAWAFVKHFIKAPSQVGSIWPSSSFLARAMVEGIDWEHDFIVELGCGTGSVTEEISRRLRNPELYLGFEIQAGLQDRLRMRFQSLRIVADSAEQLEKYLGVQGKQVHAVLSSLPFTTLDRELTKRIVSRYVGALAPGGLFRLFLYAHTVSLPRNTKFLHELSTQLVLADKKLILWNLPPAVVMTFRKPDQAS